MRQFLLLLILIPLFVLQSCGETSHFQDTKRWMEEKHRIRVLTTIAMIADVVREVGGDHVAVNALIKGDLDPHSYQLVKGDDEKLAAADLIFSNGLGLEHGPSLQQFLHDSPKVVSLGTLIAEEHPEQIIHVEGQLDPHIWMSIEMWKQIVPHIVTALSKVDPDHAAVYEINGERVVDEMEKVNGEILNTMRGVPSEKRYLVTSHDAFNYFSRTYLALENPLDWNERFAAPEGLAPESQLSTTNIQEIIDHVQKYNIHVLFPESNVSRDSIRKIVDAARQKGMTLVIASDPLYGDAMGPQGSDGDTYLKMVQHNAKTIAKNLMESQ
jgi:manganese/zinc/iron transport system substrate-binding protein